MQFPESWLRSMVDPALTTAELAHLLTMSGLEVEALRAGRAALLTAWWWARCARSTKHPNADRLTVCQVDVGTGQPAEHRLRRAQRRRRHEGALRAGRGAPAGRIARGSRSRSSAALMRGVESQGMLCSARELGLSDDHSGLAGARRRRADRARRARLAAALDDHVFTDQAHAQSRRLPVGARRRARGGCADAQRRCRRPRIAAGRADATMRPSRCSISDPAGCGRFTGRVIRNVNASAATPEWMRTAPGARRAALDLGAGGRDQLRDARAGTAAARLRPGQAARRHRRALRPQGRAPEAAQRADRGARCTTCWPSPTPPGRSGWPASWAGTAPRRTCEHPQRVPGSRVLLSRTRSPAARAATTSPATPRIASSAASTSTTTSPGSSARRS